MKVPVRGYGSGGRNKSRRGFGPSPPVEPDDGLPARGTGRSDQGCSADDVDVLAFLERWLDGREALSAPVPGADLAARALELDNADWPDHDAAEELARRPNHACQRRNGTGQNSVRESLTAPDCDRRGGAHAHN